MFVIDFCIVCIIKCNTNNTICQLLRKKPLSQLSFAVSTMAFPSYYSLFPIPDTMISTTRFPWHILQAHLEFPGKKEVLLTLDD